ncbi:hypothetical protein G6F57_010006 [Rhizopus arrhizus]|uniref:Uncharacterized protein n=1 Tax=Rhizopus oryzae TaxID=64495 RepID=A0A9P6XFI7_RHIOR|nr:hypothetical protein G6F29_014009 [Rhizopus arrhizus]KAG0995551.1 hypothetical protein G6F27_014020 [Rhizopus arrhizus]KAG1026673.1 hypothetical protein G6F26_004090 [Rhizopus arrhizus]KAG1043281.1 hypothetical protein G6F25_002535 [Rhizopus arrhizus]KAG1072151.1 hypothetical protein G6F41_003723 [Rhizopus arrhizus]
MRLFLALFGLLSALMVVFSLPLENSVALEKRQEVPAVDPTALLEQVFGLLDQLRGLIPGGSSSGSSGSASGGASGGAP